MKNALLLPSANDSPTRRISSLPFRASIFINDVVCRNGEDRIVRTYSQRRRFLSFVTILFVTRSQAGMHTHVYKNIKYVTCFFSFSDAPSAPASEADGHFVLFIRCSSLSFTIASPLSTARLLSTSPVCLPTPPDRGKTCANEGDAILAYPLHSADGRMSLDVSIVVDAVVQPRRRFRCSSNHQASRRDCV